VVLCCRRMEARNRSASAGTYPSRTRFEVVIRPAAQGSIAMSEQVAAAAASLDVDEIADELVLAGVVSGHVEV
jgi:hypothetical protein